MTHTAVCPSCRNRERRCHRLGGQFEPIIIVDITKLTRSPLSSITNFYRCANVAHTKWLSAQRALFFASPSVTDRPHGSAHQHGHRCEAGGDRQTGFSKSRWAFILADSLPCPHAEVFSVRCALPQPVGQSRPYIHLNTHEKKNINGLRFGHGKQIDVTAFIVVYLFCIPPPTAVTLNILFKKRRVWGRRWGQKLCMLTIPQIADQSLIGGGHTLRVAISLCSPVRQLVVYVRRSDVGCWELSRIAVDAHNVEIHRPLDTSMNCNMKTTRPPTIWLNCSEIVV